MFVLYLHLLEASEVALVRLPVLLPLEFSLTNSLGEFNDAYRKMKLIPRMDMVIYLSTV